MQDALLSVPKIGRLPRRPKHTFRVDFKPWEIQTCALLPVLPGETLKNAQLQARCVTAPVGSSIVGWFLEFYAFYTTHRQLGISQYMDMMLNPTITLSASAASARDYYAGLGHNWNQEVLRTIVREWFRLEGQAWDAFTIRAGRPAARLNQDTFAQSMRRDSEISTGGALATTQDEQDRLREVWEFLRGQSFTKMTYEDFLASYGVRGQAIDRDRPELLRYVREWQYPSNTVDPATGVPTSAVSWSIAERMDKDRYFSEPGFVSLVAVARPKVYLTNQTGLAAAHLDRAMRWLPAVLRDDPSTSLAEFSTTQGPFGKAAGGLTEGYWLDLRDLFLYGDQWVDAATQVSGVALPTVAGIYEYATEAMADGLFSGANKLIRMDGVFQSAILGTQMDHT